MALPMPKMRSRLGLKAPRLGLKGTRLGLKAPRLRLLDDSMRHEASGMPGAFVEPARARTRGAPDVEAQAGRRHVSRT